MSDAIPLKQIDGWEISLSKEDSCIVFNTVDYHPQKLRLTEADLWELLEEVIKEGNS